MSVLLSKFINDLKLSKSRGMGGISVQYSRSSFVITNIVSVMLLWCRASLIALLNSCVLGSCHVRHVHQHIYRKKTLQFDDM